MAQGFAQTQNLYAARSLEVWSVAAQEFGAGEQLERALKARAPS